MRPSTRRKGAHDDAGCSRRRPAANRARMATPCTRWAVARCHARAAVSDSAKQSPSNPRRRHVRSRPHCPRVVSPERRHRPLPDRSRPLHQTTADHQSHPTCRACRDSPARASTSRDVRALARGLRPACSPARPSCPGHAGCFWQTAATHDRCKPARFASPPAA